MFRKMDEVSLPPPVELALHGFPALLAWTSVSLYIVPCLEFYLLYIYFCR